MPIGIKLDLQGRRFGRLLVSEVHDRSRTATRWLCVCDCGATRVMRASQILAGRCVFACSVACPKRRQGLAGELCAARAAYAEPESVEAWRTIAGHDGYDVSDMGRVRSWMRSGGGGSVLPSPRQLTTFPNSNGYLAVTLEARQHMVHALVLLAFVGPCPNGMECLHDDRNPTNAALTNLRWGTGKENAADKARHGTQPRGERQGNARLTEEKVRAIRTASGKYRDIASQFGVSLSSVQKIRVRASWRHVG